MSDFPAVPVPQPRPFEKGGPGKPFGAVSGRTKLLETLKKEGFDPVREAIKRFRDPLTPESSKDHCLQMIMDRVLPKLKAIEVNQTRTDTQQVLINIISGEQPSQLTVEPQGPDLLDDVQKGLLSDPTSDCAK